MKKILTGLSIFSATFLMAEDGAPASAAGGLMQTLVMIGIALLFFYFILWRPEQKRRKALQNQRNSMKKGDKVTAMGIIGTLEDIQENTVILKMVDGAKVEMLKAAITDVQSTAPQENKA